MQWTGTKLLTKISALPWLPFVVVTKPDGPNGQVHAGLTKSGTADHKK